MAVTPLITWGWCGIGRVGRCVVEAHILPEFERGTQRTAPFRSLLENLRPLVEVVTSLIPRLNHGFHRNAICRRACGYTLRMTDGTATELEHHILTQIVQ